MLAVLGVVVGGLTFLLIEGSLVYYRLPSAPRWLKDDKSLQAVLSSSLTIGVVGAIFLIGQSLANTKASPFSVIEIVLAVAAVAAFVVAWRWLKGVERRLGAEDAPGTIEDASRVVALPQGATPPEAPRPQPQPRRGKGSGGRKAA